VQLRLVVSIDPMLRGYLVASRWLLLVVCCAMLVVMVGANAYNLAIRPFSDRGIMWHQEVSILAAMWVYFAAYALTSKDDTYVRIEFIVERLGTSWRKALTLASHLVTIAFHGVALVVTLSAVKIARFSETHVLELPESLYYLPLVIGSADIVITETIHLLRGWAGLPTGRVAAERAIDAEAA